MKTKIIKTPANQLLIDRGLCLSLNEASAYIYAGLVFANEQRVEKPGSLLSKDIPLRIKKKNYVSRGGDKLFKAIEELGLHSFFEHKIVLDIGSSQGGFTDCVLQLGAAKVYAVDVGFNQLDWKLRTDPRVVSLEKMDIREFDASSCEPFDWILADISFNSLENLAPYIVKQASTHTHFLILVKPQFELPKKDIPEGGIVENEILWEQAIQKAIEAFQNLGVGHFQIAKSALKGRYGNQEFFIYGSALPSAGPCEDFLAGGV